MNKLNWAAIAWISTNRGPASIAQEKTKKLTRMTFLCMTALGSKTVFHTFLPSFDNANDRLCHERLLRTRNFVSMVRWRHTSPFYCVTRGLGRREEKRRETTRGIVGRGNEATIHLHILPRAHVFLNGFLRLLICLEKIPVFSQLNISVIPF